MELPQLCLALHSQLPGAQRLYLTDKTSPAEIEKAKQSGHVYAVKLYPAGATTNSDFGVTGYAFGLQVCFASDGQFLLRPYGELG